MSTETNWKPGDRAIANLNGFYSPCQLCDIAEENPRSWLVSIDFGDGWIVDERLLSPIPSLTPSSENSNELLSTQ